MVGAQPNAEDEKLGTPLTLALQQGHEDFAMWLIERYQLSCDAQGTSLERTTPLHKVCVFACFVVYIELTRTPGLSQLHSQDD